MPRAGYKSLTIPEDVFKLIDKLRRKYDLPATELIKRSLIIFDKVMEAFKQIEVEE